MTGAATNRRTSGAMLARIARDPARRRAFAQMLAEDKYGDVERYAFGAERFYGPVRLEGRRILEIGSGRGLTTMFLALQGAATVVSMEPGLAGSRSGLQSIQQRRIDALGLQGIVELIDADFNLWDAGDRRFDVIVSESSINHLYESPHHALEHRETHDRYKAIWQHVHTLLAPGGVFCVSDACRFGFFSMTKQYGIRRPWDGKRLTTNWRIHQNPGVWSLIAREAGFTSTEVDYPLPYPLRQLGPLVANPAANFFLRARFIMRAYA